MPRNITNRRRWVYNTKNSVGRVYSFLEIIPVDQVNAVSTGLPFDQREEGTTFNRYRLPDILIIGFAGGQQRAEILLYGFFEKDISVIFLKCAAENMIFLADDHTAA